MRRVYVLVCFLLLLQSTPIIAHEAFTDWSLEYKPILFYVSADWTFLCHAD
jgi:hypothetical protein